MKRSLGIKKHIPMILILDETRYGIFESRNWSYFYYDIRATTIINHIINKFKRHIYMLSNQYKNDEKFRN